VLGPAVRLDEGERRIGTLRPSECGNKKEEASRKQKVPALAGT